MKNHNLVETRKLKNNVPVFICHRKCTPSMQQNEINRFYLWAILPDLKWKKRVDTFAAPMTSLVVGFVWAWPHTVYKQVS